MQIKNGIHTDISIQEYHANKTHLSATQLKIAKRSLKEFHWYINGKMNIEERTQFSFGNAFELALLDSKSFINDVAIMQTNAWIDAALTEKPELKQPKSSKTYQALQDLFLTHNKGKYIISDVGNESFETIEEMLSSCYQDALIQKLIQNTEYQLSLFWTDSESGLNLKTRPDICKRKKNVIVNLKTAVDGSPKAFSRDMANYEYPLQACTEIAGSLSTGLMDTVDNYFWLVVEKMPPFNATIYEFDKEDISWCMDNFRYVINKVKKAIDENNFPGYSQEADNKYGIVRAQIPLYYKN